jgi:MFS family permease
VWDHGAARERVSAVVENERAIEAGASGLLPWTRAAQFAILIVAATAAAYARFAIGPLQETMRIALSLSDNQMALLQGPALALPMAVAAIPLGLVIDRYSRVRLLLIFAVLNILGSVITAMTSRFAVLFAARCLTGLAVAAVSTTAFSLLADLYAPTNRGRATMMVVIGQYAGMSAAFALGGVLISSFGTASDAWRWAMLWMTVPLLPVAASALAMREPARIGLVAQHLPVRGSWRALWQLQRTLLPPIVGLVQAEMSVLAVLTWAAPTLSRNFALSPDRVGAIMAIALVASGILGPAAGGLIADGCQRRGGPRRTLAALSALSMVGVLGALFPAAPNLLWAAVALILFMTSVGAVIVAGIALVTIIVPAELRGLCVSVMAGAQVLFGVGIAPVMVSVLATVFVGNTAIGKALGIVALMTSVVGAAAFAFGRRSFPAAATAR